MKRREFMTLLGTGFMPLAARAQVLTILPLIAVLSVVVKERNLRMIDASPRDYNSSASLVGISSLLIMRDHPGTMVESVSELPGGFVGIRRRWPTQRKLMRSEPGSWRGP